ncbi:phage antirepressor KilAC domain-containing protein [Nocardia brasiliensis]|uniref:phage antirepressor KilAC domain-containing protein n=1 Tax=Nocardia brasiliensis TaxID=37326 RepID=UPI002454BEEE|nr:phage antirepressor KilAC domain-containing protein [Nocardia brasiliensis]
MNELMTNAGTEIEAASPFDGLRRTRPDGSEYWSARELMPLIGYTKWEHFTVPIRRAMKVAENQKHAVNSHFPGSRKVSGSRGPAQGDYELSRFGAYLVAMNGDPNKFEVAAAQSYFAIQTRRAEVAAGPVLKGPELMAAALVEANRVLEAKDATIAQLAPKARIADRYLNADGDHPVRDVAHALTRAGVDTGERRLFVTLRDLGWVGRKVPARAMQTAIDQGYVSSLPRTRPSSDPARRVIADNQVRVTPKGVDYLFDHFRIRDDVLPSLR